jgi:hypothetical protein
MLVERHILFLFKRASKWADNLPLAAYERHPRYIYIRKMARYSGFGGWRKGNRVSRLGYLGHTQIGRVWPVGETITAIFTIQPLIVSNREIGAT